MVKALRKPGSFSGQPEITKSQAALLQIEALQLTKKRSLDTSQRARLGHIRHVLKNSKLVKPIDSGSISVGSRAEIILSTGEKKVFEYISVAVSTELENDYVERISPLGQSLEGLSVNDQFRFRRGNEVIRGAVVSVDNGLDEKKFEKHAGVILSKK